MGSEGKKMNDGTRFSIFKFVVEPCVNGCRSFGDASTGNLCLRCYMSSRLQKQQAACARLSVGKSVLPRVPAAAANVTTVDGIAAKPNYRCFSCRKKVGLMGFMCRCGSTFCGAHRYAEQHSCSFDYKSAARQYIARSNPVVKADKLHCRI